eukprot:126921-Prymnesium_polylepis.2
MPGYRRPILPSNRDCSVAVPTSARDRPVCARVCGEGQSLGCRVRYGRLSHCGSDALCASACGWVNMCAPGAVRSRSRRLACVGRCRWPVAHLAVAASGPLTRLAARLPSRRRT